MNMMIHFCPHNFFSEKMLIKRNVRMHQIWRLQSKDYTNKKQIVCQYASHHIVTALGISSKGIKHNHLVLQYKFSRKEIGIDISYDG